MADEYIGYCVKEREKRPMKDVQIVTTDKGRRMAIVGVIAALVVTPVLIITDDFVLEPGHWLSGLPPEIRSGLIPIVILLASITGFYFMMKWRYSASNNDGVQAVFVILVVSLVVLTIVGVWFRGPGMKLVWPL